MYYIKEYKPLLNSSFNLIWVKETSIKEKLISSFYRIYSKDKNNEMEMIKEIRNDMINMDYNS